MSQLSGQTQQAGTVSQFLEGPAIMLPAPESQKVFPGRGPQGVICSCGPYPLSTAAETHVGCRDLCSPSQGGAAGL